MEEAIEIYDAVRKGFMLCSSKPGGPYTVTIEFRQLEDAQHLHTLLGGMDASHQITEPAKVLQKRLGVVA